ncbi:MAG TPA: hypothetical protein VK879_09570 [Candidatus Sulfomarinibacteraceae bacterium]|nr:hypothetical protein [Candidatus Sulfomarinibacteraceae bacterium]
MSERVIRASEIAEYVYCNRAWWLSRVAGYAPQNVEELARGVAYHQTHGRGVRQARLARGLAYVLVFMAVSVFVFLLIRAI